MRDAGNYSPGYNLDAMKSALEKSGGPFTLFGGEPLLMKLQDLEEILRWGFERHGQTSIQTNGALITEAHLDLFVRYKTHVGMSVDGPAELNDSRWAGTLEKTRVATAASHRAIRRLCEIERTPSLIITLYRGNASEDKLLKLFEWLRDLDALGVKSARIHALEIDHDSVRERMSLTSREAVDAFVGIMRLQDELKGLRFDVFKDMTELLLGRGQQSCVWTACDPLTTPAVQGINGLGGKSNCSRTNKDGIDWVKASDHGYERYIVLHQTPTQDGGCKDCRFFFACKGQCPGTAIDGDWRNRSEQCETWFGLFEELESRLVLAGHTPISIDAVRRDAVTKQLLSKWSANAQPTNQDHGDHWDAPDGYEHIDNFFTVHGDNGVTHTHGDHNDA